MYDELVKGLRNCAEVNSLSLYKRGLMKQAADAIEKLVKRVPPVPHGRLIDADALFKRLFVGQDGQRYPNQNVDGWDNTYNFRVIKHEIIMAPTVIEAEEGE